MIPLCYHPLITLIGGWGDACELKMFKGWGCVVLLKFCVCAGLVATCLRAVQGVVLGDVATGCIAEGEWRKEHVCGVE